MTWLKAIAISAFAILAPVHAVMATAMALVIIDMILGIWAAKKRGEPITSAALRRTVSKSMIYEIGIIVAFLAEHYMLDGALPLIKLAGAAIAMVEVKSSIENLNEINGSPIFASIITALGSKNDTDAK